jgi:hypothetical protein
MDRFAPQRLMVRLPHLPGLLHFVVWVFAVLLAIGLFALWIRPAF